MKSVYRKTLLVITGLFCLSVQAKNYLCMPSYQYNGWKDKKTIKLSSVYYKGYGQTEKEAQQEALFLCNLVYKHCTAPQDNCRPYRHEIVLCWNRGHHNYAFHHNKDSAKWIMKNMCQIDDKQHSAYHEKSCNVEKCQVVKNSADLIFQHEDNSMDNEEYPNTNHNTNEIY